MFPAYCSVNSCGYPSNWYFCVILLPRLYIKNLAKVVTNKDLHYIFGRYVDWDREEHKLMFDIRLMQEGRMKGQAFITLPTEKDAKDALRDTNGYVLKDKPMVVQFARSAKPKEDDKETAKKK